MNYFYLLMSFLWADESLIATGVITKNEGQAQEFSYERYHDKKGELTRDKSVYKDINGSVVVEEHMETVNGKLLRYDINQRQSSEKGWIVINNDQIIYNVQDREGRLKTAKRSLPENFIVPLDILPFMKKNWERLLKGESVSLKLGVWKRKDHYSFYMKKVESPSDEIIIKMQLSNIILRAFTSPLYFTFDKKSQQIKSYKGPLNLKEGSDGNFSDYVGYVEYELKKDI